jgi:hypothetical protein
MTVGEVYGALKPVLYPKGLPLRGTQMRDCNIIKGLLKTYEGEEIIRLVKAFRHEVQGGGCPAGVEPGQNFGMRALRWDNNVPLFRAKADKLEQPATRDSHAKPERLTIDPNMFRRP